MKLSTRTPSSTGMSAAVIWPASLTGALSSKMSSSAPTIVMTAAPAMIAPKRPSSGRNRIALTSTPAKIATPPRRGIERSESPRARGSSTAPMR